VIFEQFSLQRGVHEIEAEGAIPGSISIPLPRLAGAASTLDPARPTVVSCASGYRSSVAASLLRADGLTDVSDLLGGYDAWAPETANRNGAETT
jgi:hydroxyacylglutathione hydrolase